MADFWQNSMFTTLQILTHKKLSEEIAKYSRKRKIALLLPALYSEFETGNMGLIISELKHISFIETIIISLDQANREQFIDVKKRLSVLPQEVKVIWNNGERIQEIYAELLNKNIPINIAGKGRVVWTGIGYILAQNKHSIIALHDCDIKNYNKEILLRLVYPLVNPNLNFVFAKGYYARANGKLYGRVQRLFFSPFIKALRKLGKYDNQFLYFLDSFRYALSGEFAITTKLAKNIPLAPDWGLEISILNEIYNKIDLEKICQVELMDTYEHKHNPNTCLLKMATDIASTVFNILGQNKSIVSEIICKIAYMQEARKAIQQYRALAQINGLEYNLQEELQTIKSFSQIFKDINYEKQNILPSWNSIEPEIIQKLFYCVEKDNSI